MFEVIAQTETGMPAAEAIGLLPGEVATLQTSPSMDTGEAGLFFGIRKKPETRS